MNRKQAKNQYQVGEEVLVMPNLREKYHRMIRGVGSEFIHSRVNVVTEMCAYCGTKAKISFRSDDGFYSLNSNDWCWDDTLFVPYSPNIQVF